jgi:hypothetical protein
VVFKISNQHGIYVDRTPLMHSYVSRNYVDHTNTILMSQLSNKTHGDYGWMRSAKIAWEQESRNATAAKSGVTKNRWFCPLLTVSRWNALSLSGGLVVPSPSRSARLFANLTNGLAAHPTQAAGNLPNSRFENIYTSNGYCFCTNPAKCQVPRDHEACGLTETISSTFDHIWRTSVELDPPSTRCTQQLDWPFEGKIQHKK